MAAINLFDIPRVISTVFWSWHLPCTSACDDARDEAYRSRVHHRKHESMVNAQAKNS